MSSKFPSFSSLPIVSAATRPSDLVLRLGQSRVLFTTSALLLVLHLVGMFLGGFTQGFVGIAVVVTLLGLLAVPLCVWATARIIDWGLDHVLSSRGAIGGVIRLGLGVAMIIGTPEGFRLVKQLPLPLLGRAVELSAVFLSILVATGLVLVGLAIADLIYAATARFRSLSTRLMVMLLASTFGTLCWFVFLASQAQAVAGWAIEQGHLENFANALEALQTVGAGVFGGAASVVGVLELPFVLLLAWRFGHNATHGLDRLLQAFKRVGQGDLSTGLDVIGNDEVAEMQRGFNQMLLAARERRFLETAFGRYVSPVIVEQLKKSGGRVVSERRTATVLFSDIRGFTSMSAEMAPEEVIAMLNAIMSLLIEVVARHDGYINKFIGDAMLVVWNAPLSQHDHATRAVRCALDMQCALAEQASAGGFTGRVVQMGIGIHTGALVMGNLGNDRQVEFAILGDTVNTASRCCSAAARDQVLVTRDVIDAIRPTDAALADRCSSVGPVVLKGKGSLELFAVTAA